MGAVLWLRSGGRGHFFGRGIRFAHRGRSGFSWSFVDAGSDRYPSLQPRAARVRVLLDRHHPPLILSIRFLYGLRIAGPIAIGMSSVSWPRFLLINGLGAVLWAALIGSIDYGTGHALVQLLKTIDADELWGLSLLLILGLVWWLLRRRRALKNKN